MDGIRLAVRRVDGIPVVRVTDDEKRVVREQVGRLVPAGERLGILRMLGIEEEER